MMQTARRSGADPMSNPTSCRSLGFGLVEVLATVAIGALIAVVWSKPPSMPSR